MSNKQIDATQAARVLGIRYKHAVWLMRNGAFKTATKVLYNTRIRWMIDEAEVQALQGAWMARALPSTERLTTRQAADMIAYSVTYTRTMMLRGEWVTARKELLPLSRRAEWTVERGELETWMKRKEVKQWAI